MQQQYRHLSHWKQTFVVFAFAGAFALSACSDSAAPTKVNQSQPASVAKRNTEVYTTPATLPVSQMTDPATGMIGGSFAGADDSIRLDNTPVLDTVIIKVYDTITYIDTLRLGELRVDTVFVVDTVCP